MFKKALGIVGIVLLISFIALPFVSGETILPPDATAHSIGTMINQFIVYWEEVVNLI